MSGNGPPTGTPRAIWQRLPRRTARRAIRAVPASATATTRSSPPRRLPAKCSKEDRFCALRTIAGAIALPLGTHNPSTHPPVTSDCVVSSGPEHSRPTSSRYASMPDHPCNRSRETPHHASRSLQMTVQNSRRRMLMPYLRSVTLLAAMACCVVAQGREVVDVEPEPPYGPFELTTFGAATLGGEFEDPASGSTRDVEY